MLSLPLAAMIIETMLVSFLSLSLIPIQVAAASSYVKVKDGIVSQLTVSIGQNVPQQNCPLFLDNLEVKSNFFYFLFFSALITTIMIFLKNIFRESFP